MSLEDRQEISENMEDLFRLEDSNSVISYVGKMRNDKEWGSGLELLAAGYLYKRPVWIWQDELKGQPHRLNPIKDSSEVPIGVINIQGRHWDSVIITNYVVNSSEIQDEIEFLQTEPVNENQNLFVAELVSKGISCEDAKEILEQCGWDIQLVKSIYGL